MAESWESKAIKKASEDWWKAYRKGDQAAMKKARNTAEKLRRKQGYSLNGAQKGNLPKVTDKTKWEKTSASKKIITTSTFGTKPKIDLGLGYTASNMSKLATLQKANPPEKKPINGSANARARGALSTASKLPQGKTQEVRQNAGLPSISKIATLQSQQRKVTSENKKGNDASNAGSRSKSLVGARLSSSETRQRKGNAGGRSDLIRARESAVAKGTNTFPESGLRLSAYGKSVPAEGKNTLSNDKKKNILREAFDKEETYVDKFKRGNLGGGMANLLGTTLQAPQSLWLNLNNQVASVAQGKGLQPFHYNMDYGDYEGEVAKRAGTVPLGQQISEKNKVLGELYRLGMETGTDPLTLLDAGGVLKTMGKNIPGSPTQAKELLALKLAEQAEKERRLKALKEGLPRRGETKISNTKPGTKGNVLGVMNENVKSPRKQGAMQEEGLEKARALLKEKWYNSVKGRESYAIKDGAEGAGNSITYRRVQGGNGSNASRRRISVNLDGSVSISNKNQNLSVSIDGGEHSAYFRNNVRGNKNTYIVEFDVPKWFDDFLKESVIPQKNYWRNPLNVGGAAPKQVDITKSGRAFELPPPWVEWIEEYATNAKIK